MVIVIPILSLLGFIASCIITVQAPTHIATNAQQRIALDVGLTPITVFTLLTNFYCTVLITWEIWRITKNCKPVGGTNLRASRLVVPLEIYLTSAQHFLAIVVESAAIYTFLNSTLQYIALNTFPPVAGIANGLIHVRVGLGQTVEQIYGSSKTSSSVVTSPMRFTAPQPSGIDSGENGTVGQISRV
ncbi:hypothetical protein DFH07DRAFT_1005189 [Mycena maculata]|uniref:Uncharacterized protein n=1 Tax=Mycena maculata TaxID=230809 RepID=A0AAD7HLQ5_9AGAR|nr:hypothetical protein DFH07DRAFT_1005189 [Mycena maculata]